MLTQLLTLTTAGREHAVQAIKALRECALVRGIQTAKRIKDEVDLGHPVIIKLRDGAIHLARLQEFYCVKQVELKDLPPIDPEKVQFAAVISWLDEMEVFKDNQILGDLCDHLSCSIREANRIIDRANKFYDDSLAGE